MHEINVSKYEEQTKHPGKFEGEEALTPYLYEQSMDGDGETLASLDEDGHSAILFKLQGDEPEAFDREHGEEVVLVEDSQGFVFNIPLSAYKTYAK